MPEDDIEDKPGGIPQKMTAPLDLPTEHKNVHWKLPGDPIACRNMRSKENG